MHIKIHIQYFCLKTATVETSRTKFFFTNNLPFPTPVRDTYIYM